MMIMMVIIIIIIIITNNNNNNNNNNNYYYYYYNPSFGGKGPHLRQWPIVQPSSNGLFAGIFLSLKANARRSLCADPVSFHCHPYH